MNTDHLRASAMPFIVSFAVTLLLCMSAEAQPQSKKYSKEKTTDSSSALDVERWRIFLDQLGGEARTLLEERNRPFVVAEVADAYWSLDKVKSKELFMFALEAALALKAGTKDASQAIGYVLALAAKRDASLSESLTKRLIEHRAKEGRQSIESVEAALDLLKSDPKKAAQLMEAGAFAGPSMDGAWFIFQLAESDPVAAEHVYRTYLSSFTASRSPDLSHLLWLAGYPFGYSEAYGGANDPTQLPGFGGLHISGLAPNPILATSFLDLMFQVIQGTLEQARSSPPSEGDVLNSLALFATNYLLPEAARYRPNTVQAWQVLYQQALAGTSVVRQAGVAKRLQSIAEVRSKVNKSPKANANEQSQADLDDAEKLPEGCQRDQLYARAIMGITYAKNFPRALAIAERIKNPSLVESVRQYIYYAISSAAIDGKGLYDARQYAERVTAPEQRVLLYVKMARAALRRQDRVHAAVLLRETRRLAESVSETGTKASALLAAAAVFAMFDPLEAYDVLREAIKAVNQVHDHNVDTFLILRRVDLTCPGGEDFWYGGSEQPERFSLLETSASLAGLDIDAMLSMARDIEDPATRIRTLASIVRAIIKQRQP